MMKKRMQGNCGSVDVDVVLFDVFFKFRCLKNENMQDLKEKYRHWRR
jgi:hypothetical protein